MNQVQASELLYFTCKLQGAEFTCLLDSGAGRTFLDYKTAVKRGISLESLEESFEVKVADGSVIKCRHQVDRKSNVLKFKQFKHRAPIYVLDLNEQHQIILGQDFLKSRNPIIDWQERTMTLRKRHRYNAQAAVMTDDDYVTSVTIIR